MAKWSDAKKNLVILTIIIALFSIALIVMGIIDVMSGENVTAFVKLVLGAYMGVMVPDNIRFMRETERNKK